MLFLLSRFPFSGIEKEVIFWPASTSSSRQIVQIAYFGTGFGYLLRLFKTIKKV
jgi:hypothetical protein